MLHIKLANYIYTHTHTVPGATQVREPYVVRMRPVCRYKLIRAQLITRLNRSPPIQNTHPNNPELTLFIDQQAQITNLMNIL